MDCLKQPRMYVALPEFQWTDIHYSRCALFPLRWAFGVVRVDSWAHMFWIVLEYGVSLSESTENQLTLYHVVSKFGMNMPWLIMVRN